MPAQELVQHDVPQRRPRRAAPIFKRFKTYAANGSGEPFVESLDYFASMREGGLRFEHLRERLDRGAGVQAGVLQRPSKQNQAQKRQRELLVGALGCSGSWRTFCAVTSGGGAN